MTYLTDEQTNKELVKLGKKKMKFKENIIEKSPVIKEAEKQKGIVQINFDDEKIPIQNIKKAKKSSHKPQKQEIQEKKIAETPDLEEIDDIKQLEKEIKEKKKILKIKKQKEEEEKLKQIEAEQKRVTDEINAIKNKEVQIPQEIKDIEEVELNFMDNESLKFCPICKSKIKRKAVKKDGFTLTQLLKCKNKECKWEKDLIFNI